jgi:cellobiose phosphorylase
VETPDVEMNRMLNTHNPRQCHTTLNWSRYLSYYQLGYGARGIGFRDSSQDVMGVLGNAPTEGRQMLDKLLSVQKQDGSAMHQFNPLTMVAAQGDSTENPDAPHYYSDDHLWGILGVVEYIKETGDFGYLQQSIPFYEKSAGGQPLEIGSVLDHLQRGLAFTRSDTGAHGLPRLGYADWNDTINLHAGAESLFTACLYGRALQEIISLLRYLGNEPQALVYEADYEQMKQVANQQAWDGEWYINYFDHDGTPLGSQANSHGQIYNYGQSWAVISGFAGPERGRQALDSANRLLSTAYGVKVSTPGFNGFDPHRGGITTYPPGAKENCGIFLHTNPWMMIAETLLGNGDRAYAYYRQINPVGRNDQIERYECEPYVYPQNILGDEHTQFGLARNSWLSGTASWAYQAGIKYILGVCPAFEGLLVDPCIPRHWSTYRVVRHFRGSLYDIHVHNPKHVNRGVTMLQVDGMAYLGNALPVFTDGRTHLVAVTLG